MPSTTKTDNHDPRGKLALRRYFLDKYHADGSANVLDCCQGGGVMWSEIQKTHKIASYWGLDVKPKKGRLKLDSVRVLAQPGWPQDVIDVDTYGSPWKHWFAMLPNITRPTTVFLTIGATLFCGATDTSSLAAMGCVFKTLKLPTTFYGALSQIGVSYCLTRCCVFSIIITDAVEAVSTGNARYIGVRIEKRQAGALTPVCRHTQAAKGLEHV